MTVTLKSSPDEDSFGRNRPCSLSMFLCSKNTASFGLHYFKVEVIVSFPLRFLYSELLKHYDGTEDSIFEPGENNKLQIKSDITFHLYIRWEYQMFSLFTSSLSILFFLLLTFVGVSCLVQCDPFSFVPQVVMVNVISISCLFLLSIARHLVGTALCLISPAVRREMTSRVTSLCLRIINRANSAPKLRTVRDDSDKHSFIRTQLGQLSGL